MGRNKTFLLGQGRQKGEQKAQSSKVAIAWDKTDREENVCICSRSLSVFVYPSLSMYSGPWCSNDLSEFSLIWKEFRNYLRGIFRKHP